jgi:hypothetical protein
VHDQENEDGNPLRLPAHRHCAPIFHMYRYIWTLLGRAFENNADPGPVVRYPREDPTTLKAKDGKAISQRPDGPAHRSRRRSGSTIALPSEVYTDIQDKPTGVKKWDIEYPKAETNFDAIHELPRLPGGRQAARPLAPGAGPHRGPSGATSNRNVASEFGDQRDASQSSS